MNTSYLAHRRGDGSRRRAATADDEHGTGGAGAARRGDDVKDGVQRSNATVGTPVSIRNMTAPHRLISVYNISAMSIEVGYTAACRRPVAGENTRETARGDA